MKRRSNDGGPGLFKPKRAAGQPLADRMRPRSMAELVGQEHLLGPGRLLAQMAATGALHSIILWGPPGTGKTTIARLLAENSGARFESITAVTAGVAELREAVAAARHALDLEGKRTVLFIDEIHRWNRAQQDAILPHVESGLITLIGATTENPSFEVIAPLLSRARVVVLQGLSDENIAVLLDRAIGDPDRGLGGSGLAINNEARAEIVRFAGGDARRALGTLEVAAELAINAGRRTVEAADVTEAAQHKALLYDRAGEEHYNVISAFIKSLRGSDPDAALYWMTRMVEAGEEPMFIARRMVIFASEDIGNADPRALQIALAVKDAVDFVGLPEGIIPLAQGVTYLAGAPKSNASYRAMIAARADAREHGALPVPLELRNAPTGLMRTLGYGADYRYPHDYEDAVADQAYRPDKLEGRIYYQPSDRGYEARVRDYLEAVRRRRTDMRRPTCSRDNSAK
ncbi:MAG TPA: replication-associated recombination protein A [Candidatus Binataceae bacterium]|nr:replication-associated recombination protein A [Candidatus Binataceae bacterium]